MTPQTSKNRRALLYGLCAVAGWSTVATAFKLALAQLTPYQLLFYANLAAVIFLTVLIAITNQQRELISSARQHWQLTLAAGCLNPVLYYCLLFGAYDLLPAQVAMSINYSWAIVLTFMASIFLRHRISLVDWIAAFVCYAGVIVIATAGRLELTEGISLAGFILAIGSTIVWAAYWTMNVKDVREPIVGLALNFLVALPITFLICALLSELTVSIRGLIAAGYVGFVEMAIGFLLWSIALRETDNASRISNLIFLSPFLSLVFIYWILDEVIRSSTLVGLVVIVGALASQQFIHARRESLEIKASAPK